MEIKRLFFAAEVKAAWPSHFPSGKIIDEPYRHLTLAFLGTAPIPPLPLVHPSFQIGPCGLGTKWIFLPNEQGPRVVAEEMPQAYKDVDEVVLAVEKARLAKKVAHLKPSLVLKG